MQRSELFEVLPGWNLGKDAYRQRSGQARLTWHVPETIVPMGKDVRRTEMM